MFEKPSQSLIESACMSFRHDFGLIPALAAAPVMVEAEQWLAAWRVGFEPYSSSPVFTGLGSGWVEPNAHIVDVACLAFDQGFRQRPFHEATTIRRGGISWLQAWRHAFEDQPRKPIGLSSRTVPVDDHPQRPVIRDADEPLGAGVDVGFYVLIAEAVATAGVSMRKFPAPNYTISKFAEESGEVVKAAIHCAENRESYENLRGEMVQAVAMLYRLWVEGDQVHGLKPVRTSIPAVRP